MGLFLWKSSKVMLKLNISDRHVIESDSSMIAWTLHMNAAD